MGLSHQSLQPVQDQWDHLLLPNHCPSLEVHLWVMVYLQLCAPSCTNKLADCSIPCPTSLPPVPHDCQWPSSTRIWTPSYPRTDTTTEAHSSHTSIYWHECLPGTNTSDSGMLSHATHTLLASLGKTITPTNLMTHLFPPKGESLYSLQWYIVFIANTINNDFFTFCLFHVHLPQPCP